jgi:hypothetical protein
MKREPVASSALRAVGYQARRRLLELQFVDGAVYHYANVPARVFKELMAAPSKGKFFAEKIRDRYPCQQREPRDRDRLYGPE